MGMSETMDVQTTGESIMESHELNKQLASKVLELQTLFNRISEAHHVYERDFLLNVRDTSWAEWYARAAISAGFGKIVPNVNLRHVYFLGAFLMHRTKLAPAGADWAKFMAEEIVKEFQFDIVASIV